jgi:hypothetical protein
MADDIKGVLKEIPNIIVLILLIAALLFVATKFKWVHCSQIPQWCDVYCRITGNSQVAVIYGAPDDPGTGDALLLRRRITAERLFTNVVPFRSSELSGGILDDYEMVALTQFKRITLREAIVLRDFLNKGGSLLWEGDAASEYRFSGEDDTYARQMNLTSPGFYEAFKDAVVNKSKGFGILGDILGAQYNKTVPANPQIIRIKALSESHMVVQGVKNFNLSRAPYAIVTADPRYSTQVAVFRTPDDKSHPMFLDRKYVGRLFYTAVPLEYIDSRTLLTNVMDYMVTC